MYPVSVAGPHLCFDKAPSTAPKIVWRSAAEEDVRLNCTPSAARAGCLQCKGSKVATADGAVVVDGRPLPFRAQWRPAPEHHAPVRDALARAKQGKTKEALAVLDRGQQRGERWARVWSAVYGFYLRYEALGGTRRIDQALVAAETAERERIPSEASKRYRMAGHLAIEARRFAQAAALLARAEALVPDLAKEQARLTYEKGVLYQQLEQFRQAEPLLRQALQGARAAGQVKDIVRFAQVLAVVNAQLGQFDDALRILREHVPSSSMPPELQAEYYSNVGGVMSQAMLAGALPRQPQVVDQHYVRSADLFNRARQPDRALARRIERAWWASQTNRIEAADTLLEGLDKAPAAVAHTRWLLPLTRAAVLIATGQTAKATTLLAQAEEGIRAEREGQPSELVASAAELRAAAAQKSGQFRLAADLFERALHEAERLSRRALLRRSAGGLLQRLSGLRAQAVEAQVQAADAQGALIRADRARTVLLRRLRDLKPPEDKAAWAALENRRTQLIARLRKGCVEHVEPAACRRRLDHDLEIWGQTAAARFRDPPASDLSAPPPKAWLEPGQGLAMLEPRTDGGWRWFHLDRGQVTTGTTADPARPWSSIAAHHQHLYVVADQAEVINAIITAFEVGEGPSISTIPAGSWLRWPRAPTSPDRAPLIIVDEGGLNRTSVEGDWLKRRWPTANVLKIGAFKREGFERHLSTASRLHFAGHGRLAGSSPWTTFLDLGPLGAFTLEDVLLQRPQLDLAVLNGCETGGTSSPFEIGLPQALLATGTKTVVATVRPVIDAAAWRFIRAFYELGGADRPAAAFRRAVDRFRREGDPAWQEFRIWGR